MNKLTEMVRAKVDLDEAAKPTKMAHIYYSPLGKKMVGSKKVGAVPRKDLNTELKRLAKAHKATVQDFEYYDRDLGEGLWADKKKAWMATFENNVVSSDGSHQGKIDWHTAQYLHKQNHTPAAAAEAYLKAKGPKARGVTYESFSDTVKKVGKNLAARPNKGSMPGAKRVKKMTEEEQLDEGKMKELAMDFDDLGHPEFTKKYGKSKDEMHRLLGHAPGPQLKPKTTPAPKKVTEGRLGKDEADEDERAYGEPMGVPTGPGKSAPFSSQRALKGLKTRIKNANSGANDPNAKANAKMAKMPVRGALDEVHAPGTTVTIHDGGKRKTGKVVRHVPHNKYSGESEAYVVDTGEYESKMVPVHRVHKEGTWPWAGLDEATARGIARARKLSSYADQYKQRAADVRDKHPEEAMRHLRVASDWRRKAAAALAMREDTELDEATAPKYDPAKMDEFEAAKEFQYHAGRSAFHRNSQGWTGRLNDIYNRDWKKEASHHERHMKALKKVMDFHKTRKEEAEIDYPTLDEEVELHEGSSIADMHPDNINSIIKQHGKQHRIYTGAIGDTRHGLGFKELKAKLGVGTSAGVHKKFVAHLEKNGFKSSWSHTTNEWMAHSK